MKTPKPHFSPYITTLLAGAGIVGMLSGNVQAANVSWQSAATGGAWSTGTNWSSGSVPGSSDSVTIGNATANRVITVSSATTTGTLTMSGTSGFTNELDVTQKLTVNNNIYLSASSGTSVIRLGDKNSNTATTYLALNRANLSAGGWLILQVGGTANGGQANMSGNMTIGGGVLSILAGAAGDANASQAFVSGAVTMTSGSILLSDTCGNLRLGMTSLNATGGAIVSNFSTNYLMLTGSNATNTIGSGVTVSGGPTIYMTGNNSILNYDATGAATALIRNLTAGTTAVTLQTSVAGGTASFNTIQVGQQGGNGASSLAKIILGSNVKTTSSSSPVLGIAYSSGSTDNFELDLGGHTFDATASTAGWTAQTSATTNWTISSSGSAGTLKVLSVNLSTPNTQTTIGGGVTLWISGGGSTNVLSGSGTIAPTSTFRYTGTTGTATLTSNRTIGRLEVGNGSTASSLSLTGADLTVGADVTVNSNSVLDLAGKNLAESAVTGGTSGGLNGSGTLRNNTTATAVTLTLDTTNGNGNFSGNIVDHSTGTGTVALTKIGSGTQTLSGANSYTGATTVSAGELDINGSSTGSAISVAGGAVLGGSGSIVGTVSVNSSTINGNGLALNSAVFSGASFLKGNSSATNGYTVSSGTLAVSGTTGSSIAVNSGVLQGTGKVGNVTLNGSLAGTLTTGAITGSGSITPGNSPGILTATSVDLSAGISFKFELTTTVPTYSTSGSACGNDVLRLTSADPFAGSTASSSNIVDIYLGVTTLTLGNTFQGGIFADSGSLSPMLSGAYEYYVLGDGNGTHAYNGYSYYTLSEYNASLSIDVSTSQVASATFSDGSTVSNGSVLEFTVVPEPSSWAMLVSGIGALLLGQSLRRRSAA